MKNIDGNESNTAKGVNIATEFHEFKDTSFNKKIGIKQEEFKVKNIKWEHTKSTKYHYVLIIKDALHNGIHTLAYFHIELKKKRLSQNFHKWLQEKQMHLKRGLIGGLIGVHVSSIVK